MKRITLTCPDYGLAFGVDRAVRELVAAGRLSAVGCIVASDLWSREFLPLREAVNAPSHVMIGLTVALTAPWAPVSVEGQKQFGPHFPRPRWWTWRSTFHVLPSDALRAEIAAQFERFVRYYQRGPDFVTVAGGLHRCRGIARALFDSTRDWVVPPLIVSPFPPGPAADRFRSRAAEKGLLILPRGADLPQASDPAAVADLLWRQIDREVDRAVVECHPAEIDDRLRRLEPQLRLDMRRAQHDLLSSAAFDRLLMQKDVFLY